MSGKMIVAYEEWATSQKNSQYFSAVAQRAFNAGWRAANAEAEQRLDEWIDQ